MSIKEDITAMNQAGEDLYDYRGAYNKRLFGLKLENMNLQFSKALKSPLDWRLPPNCRPHRSK